MADRQGLLKGLHISTVQSRAIWLLELCAIGDRREELQEHLHQRLYATGNYAWEDLFGPPSGSQGTGAGQVEYAEDVEEATTQMGDAVSTRYVFDEDAASEEVDPHDAEAMIAELMGQMSQGTFTGADAGGGWM